MQNRSLLLVAPQQLEWVSETLPPLKPYEVRIKTSASAISVGSELARYLGQERHTATTHYPLMTGYESLGTVIETGSNVHDLPIGSRVVSFYGHRTIGTVPRLKALPVPPEISDEQALLAILSCDAAKGIHKLKPGSEDSILISGAGAMGLLAVGILKAQGIRKIDIIEPLAERRKLALQLGARHAFDPSWPLHMPGNYKLGIECSSRNSAFELLQANLHHGGRICILADGNYEPLVLSACFHEKELTIIGSSDGLDYQSHARRFFSYLAEHSTPLEDLFTYSIEADNLARTFEEIANGSIQPIKVFVRYGS